MKKVTMIFAVLALLVSSNAIANPGENISKTVQAAFQKGFSKALNVNWEVTDDLYFASFDLDGKSVNAAFNENGELVGVSRKMSITEIPLIISQSLKSDFADYKIAESATEVTYEGNTFYYVNATGKTRDLKLKCYTDGQINVESRSKK